MGSAILLIGNFLSKTSGVKSVSEELLDHLSNVSTRPIITTSSQRNRLKRLLDIMMTIVFHRSRYDIASIDVFSGLAFIGAEISALLLYWLHKPFILALHGGGLPRLAERAPRRVRRLLSSANAVVTPSCHIQQELRTFREDIAYLPNGLVLQRYPFRLRVHPAPRLGWLRAFHEIYNPVMAIQVILHLRENFPDIHLTMIGPDKKDGTYVRVLKMIRDHALEEQVEVVGAVDKEEVPSWLQKFDVFINTTRLESFGVAVMEAGAVGLPIVMTNVGELPFLWSDNHNALLTTPGDAKTMAAAVQRILTEPGLAEKLSQNARRNAEKYDWSVLLPCWDRLFDLAVRNGKDE